MSRITYPPDFAGQLKLLHAIKARHDADGAASVLIPYLAQHDIDLAADVLAAAAAAQHDNDRALLQKQSENMRQLRNLHWNPVIKRLRKYYQYIKIFYSPNFMSAGAWGASITTSGRLTYPPEFLQRTRIIQNLRAKYDTYAPNPSPLDPFLTHHGFSVAIDTSETDFAINYHNQAEQNARDSEAETQLRNNIWKPIMKNIRGVGNYLIKLFNNNPKALGFYGFTVDNSPRPPKLQTSTVLPASHRTIRSVNIGGKMVNIGTSPLYIYKGNKATGVYLEISPNTELKITKGFSVITIANPSSLEKGKFQIHVSRK